jgi:aminobenzoyl-glutamate utilization protein A
MTNDYNPENSIAANFPAAVEWRRTLHRCPQPPWLEFFATAFVAEKLAGWGYALKMGNDIIPADKQLLLPDTEKLEEEYQRAIRAGAKEQFLVHAKGGFTGVVAVLQGDKPGPTIAFRFDIDSNEVMESLDAAHRPAKDGFSSQNPGYAHMCGHDAHIAVGLLLAKHFADNRADIKGTVKFIFQPNEENLSGAAAMIARGVLDDVDFLFSGHVGLALKTLGQISFNIQGFMALTRYEVTYTGRPSHAALRPDQGKNALLGSCAAISNLYAIARHGSGASRINVGYHQAGSAWNVIPEKAYFRIETRGVSNEINAYMGQKALEVIEGAARMYDLKCEVKKAAEAIVASNSPEMITVAERVAKNLASVQEVVPEVFFGASEDVTLMMEKVKERGGRTLVALFGTPIYGGHHNSSFDVDERVIQNAAEFFAALHKAVSTP